MPCRSWCYLVNYTLVCTRWIYRQVKRTSKRQNKIGRNNSKTSWHAILVAQRVNEKTLDVWLCTGHWFHALCHALAKLSTGNELPVWVTWPIQALLIWGASGLNPAHADIANMGAPYSPCSVPIGIKTGSCAAIRIIGRFCNVRTSYFKNQFTLTAHFSSRLFSKTTGPERNVSTCYGNHWFAERISLCSFLCWLSKWCCHLNFVPTLDFFWSASRKNCREFWQVSLAICWILSISGWCLVCMSYTRSWALLPTPLVWTFSCCCNTWTCARIAWGSASTWLLAARSSTSLWPDLGFTIPGFIYSSMNLDKNLRFTGYHNIRIHPNSDLKFFFAGCCRSANFRATKFTNPQIPNMWSIIKQSVEQMLNFGFLKFQSGIVQGLHWWPTAFLAIKSQIGKHQTYVWLSAWPMCKDDCTNQKA